MLSLFLLALSYGLAIVVMRPLVLADNRQHVAFLRSELGVSGPAAEMVANCERWSRTLSAAAIFGSLLAAILFLLLWVIV